MFTDPVSLATLVAGAILTVTLVGAPGGLAMWAEATACAIAATSMAQAAGVKNPVVLSIIGAMAGAVGAGASTFPEFLKTAAAWGVGQGLDAAEGSKFARYLSLINMLGSSLVVNATLGQANWAFTPYGAIDPVYKVPLAGGGFLVPIWSSLSVPGLEAYTYVVWDDYGNIGLYFDVSERIGVGGLADITVGTGYQKLDLDNIGLLPKADIRDVNMSILPVVGGSLTSGGGWGASASVGVGVGMYTTTSVQNGLIYLRTAPVGQ
jgi:hypothetical protein